MTLRSRLVVVAVLVLAVLGSVGLLLPRIVRTSLVDQADHQIDAAAPVAFDLVHGARVPRPGGSPTRTTRLSELYVARIVGESRDVVVAPASVSGREPQLPQRTTTRSDPKPVTVGSVRGGASWRAIRVSLPDGSSALVALSLDRVNATMHRLVLALWFAGIAILVALVAGGWWLWRLGLRPIAEVTSVAGAIAAGDRSRRVRESPSGTEAASLARAFNVMLDEQQASEDRVRRFVSDASHELRTPVAAIGGFADLWRQGPVEDDQLGEMMRRIGQESVRMQALVEDLLLLARLDEGAPMGRGPVDLAALARDAAIDASATHPSRIVVVDSPGLVIVEGNEAGLRQVVGNLVANALVHGGEQAIVRVGTESHGPFGVLTVSDDGVGMSADDAAQAFDRFWRGDPARSRSGSGLGLAIVRGVVEAHGGQVDLRSSPGVGTTVRVVLPVAAATP